MSFSFARRQASKRTASKGRKLARRQASKCPTAKALKERLRHSQTAWPHGIEGRNEPPGNGLYCLTLLSERTLAAGNFSSDALPLLQAGSADISRIGYLSKTHLVRDCLKLESCQMWNRNFRARRLSKTNNCKLANRRLKRRSKHDPPLAKRVRASPCISRCVLCCKMQHFAHRLSLKNAFGARLPSNSEI